MTIFILIEIICVCVFINNFDRERMKDKRSTEETGYPVPEQPYFYKCQMENITGIEVGYEEENLTQEDIWNIAQLYNLKQLNICIGDTSLDLSQLGNLTGLETLTINIQGNGDVDLSFMENLDLLTKLDISVGSNTDLTPLGSLTRLKQLSMSRGDNNDLSFLRNLKQLEEVILIKWCTVEDLSFFKNMLCLRKLYVTYVGDVDLCELANLKMLEELTIVGEHVRNLEGLSNLSHLRSLSLEDNSAESIYDEQEREVLDLEPLEKLTELRFIFLGYIRLEDVRPLAALPNLYSIELMKTDVDSILPLNELENLKELIVYGNTSNQVQEQAEAYFHGLEYITVTDELPY